MKGSYRQPWCRGKGICRHALPGGNHRINALIQCLFTQIGSPRKRRDDHICFIIGWRADNHAYIADKHQRTNISADQIVFTQRGAAGFHQFVNALRYRHAVDLRRIVQTLHMLTVTEHYRAFVGIVAAHPFKHGRTIVQSVRHHVHLGFNPWNHLTIKPNIIGFLRHCCISFFVVYPSSFVLL
ncbi:hypothetical protein SSYM_2053 [Serratia symbiotica str. Tucson]|uniref:Uncharacterized protein n=1 Tax=Serratia symbiotica str. Tucson TaxID=914128 RepID=E9CNN7_9GAMM|nr:hypothetical protein SSYM_2053 [Serratia symbiotica str. Tucson]